MESLQFRNLPVRPCATIADLDSGFRRNDGFREPSAPMGPTG